MNESTKRMNEWATTKCEGCGGHGGGHFDGCERKIVETKEKDGETIAQRYGCGCYFKGDFSHLCTKHEAEFQEEFSDV